jgi:hypothetical protein
MTHISKSIISFFNIFILLLRLSMAPFEKAEEMLATKHLNDSYLIDLLMTLQQDYGLPVEQHEQFQILF